MSYRGSGYRGPGDRSRSPSRFDRRQSAANIYDGRHAGPPRSASDAPRGPRSQFDGPAPRGPPPGNLGSGPALRTLRDAPPLGTTNDRGRTFRERDYPERRDRTSPPPRERSPPRKFNDFPPRDIDVRPARRSSRDGPLSAGSSYSETAPFTGSSSFRGGGYRGRGRGSDFSDRGSGRGGRRNFDDRGDLFPRARSPPPPRYARDLSRDSRDSDRRDDRRFERREDERRPDWVDRERDVDRTRRDPPPGRLESRLSSDSVPSANGSYQQSQAPPINPERLAFIESSGADPSVRRPSSANAPPPASQRPSEQPAFLTGRKDSTANRYSSRGSSPPAQAPAVPAFSFSVAGPGPANHPPPQAPRALADAKSQEDSHLPELSKGAVEDTQAPPPNVPTAPKAAPAVPRPQHASPPPAAPKAPRALELDTAAPSGNRLQGVRSLESLGTSRADQSSQPPAMPASPGLSRQNLPHLVHPVSPSHRYASRPAELSAPTGPKATRPAPAQGALSPRPPLTSPRSDVGSFQPHHAGQRAQTPPPSAPSGPRHRSFSSSPKVATSSIPTAPKAARIPQFPPRAAERPLQAPNRPLERPAGMPLFAPSGPRSGQWNLWRRPGVPNYGEKPSIPAKRDANGEEKERQPEGYPIQNRASPLATQVKTEERESALPSLDSSRADQPSEREDKMDIDKEPRRRSTAVEGHSAAQSFFGKTLEKSEDEIASSSEDDELDEEEDATLLEAKHARKERELRSGMYDLGSRQYRATSPLESIGRLVRFSVSELERINAQRDEEMDIDDTATDSHHPGPAVQSSESDEGPEVATPRGPDTASVAVREQDQTRDHIRRVRRQSPEPITLPYLLRGEEVLPLAEIEDFQDTVKALEETEQEMVAALEDEVQAEDEAEGEAQECFEDCYKAWREECEDIDREIEERERLERQLSAEPNAEFDATMAASMNPILEGRRLHKFNSEYEFEQVLKQSEETARIEKERQEREAKKKEADMEKEAILPDQQSMSVIARSVLVDTNRLRDPTSLTLVFSYEPPADTFTAWEQDVFVAAFKETPKKWGEIAGLLEGRTYKDCIHHYYANKWDGRFRDNKAKKFKGGRRGRGGKSRGQARTAMADLTRSEDLIQAPADSATGRPKRAAAPTTFGEREIESKNSLLGQSPAKKGGPGGEGNGEKPAKKSRKTGEKPGRKAKTQLAALAAAPALSPNKQLLHSKDELARAQHLEDASLLTNLQAGQSMTHPEGHMGYNPDGFAGHSVEEVERPKPAAPVAKQGASSYWSVPEQTDFFKYIAHFGTDYGAIASHMGTKTQTMIKNHYQRQIDGGRGDLEELALKANARIKRGEDIGPPPTPTPIVKRKYDNPQSSTPRAIAPQTDAMMTDEPGPSSNPPLPKHGSPPQSQYQAKPRFNTSAQNTPSMQRVAPSPRLAATSAPNAPPIPAVPHGRGLQHPLGSRHGFITDHRSEIPRPASVMRMDQEPPPLARGQPPAPQQQSRNLSNAADPQFLQSLRHEQEKAMRVQARQAMQAAEYGTEPRPGSIHGHQQPPMHGSQMHGSPALQPVPAPVPDRNPGLEDQRPTPPGQRYPQPGSMRSSMYGSSSAQQVPSLTGTPISSALSGRGLYHPSPPGHEVSRPGSVPTSAPLHPTPMHHIVAPTAAPAPAPTPAPDPPKRSNLLSILNDEPEEPKPAPKRDSLPSAPTRVASPAAGFPPASGHMSSATPRRETFGQPSMPHSHLPNHRSPFGQPSSSTPGPPTSSLKHEHSSGSTSSLQQSAQQEWGSRMYGPGSQSSPPSISSALDREGRPAFYSHSHRSSALGSLNQPARAIPSPPPYLQQHSRTPSLTAQQAGPNRGETRSALGPLSGPAHQSVQALHPGAYAAPQQPRSPFAQTSQVHHSQHSSAGERGSMLPPFGMSREMSREEAYRLEDEARARQQHRENRDRVEQQRIVDLEAEKRRRNQYQTQRQQEEEMELMRQDRAALQQTPYSRGPPVSHQPMHPSSFGAPYSQSGPGGIGGGFGIREMSAVETEHAVRVEQQQRRMEDEDNRRRHEQQQQQQQQRVAPLPSYMRDREGPADPMARRPDDFPVYRRTTPHGGQGQGFPPPAGRR